MGGTNGVITNYIADTFASNDIKNQCLNNLFLKLGKVIDSGKEIVESFNIFSFASRRNTTCLEFFGQL